MLKSPNQKEIAHATWKSSGWQKWGWTKVNFQHSLEHPLKPPKPTFSDAKKFGPTKSFEFRLNMSKRPIHHVEAQVLIEVVTKSQASQSCRKIHVFQALIESKSKWQDFQLLWQNHPFNGLVEAVLKGQCLKRARKLDMFQGIHQPWFQAEKWKHKCGKRRFFRVHSRLNIEIELKITVKATYGQAQHVWGNVGARNQAPNLSLQRLRRTNASHLEGFFMLFWASLPSCLTVRILGYLSMHPGHNLEYCNLVMPSNTSLACQVSWTWKLLQKSQKMPRLHMRMIEHAEPSN